MKDEGGKNFALNSEAERWRQVKDVFLQLFELSDEERQIELKQIEEENLQLKAEVEDLLQAHFESESFIEKPAYKIDKEEWKQVSEIVLQAFKIDEEKRSEFIRKRCANAPHLQNEVESLLAKDIAAENFFDDPAVALYAELFGDNETLETNAGREIGHYRIIREIGHGGMGAVYLAERADGEFQQKVAIKLIRQNILDSHVLKNFKRERQILASLHHPFIAQVVDGGVSNDGAPFLVMEYVEGEPITEYADKNRLGVKERLRLFLKVCRGVGFAHRNLIVHRDLKPSNIFVTPDGDPKLLDFGLAKLLDENLSDAAQTITAFRAMTPAYASPEQLRGESMTTATDVYSLGVVLYELLTGTRPFYFKNQTLDEAVRLVCHTEPLRPSKAVAQDKSIHFTQDDKGTRANAKTEQSTKFAGFSSTLKGDLDNIILTALSKEPERRYSSVEQFAQDIERYLDGVPISARPNNFSYRAEKFIKRNKITVSAVALVFLTLIGGIIATVRQSRAAADERDKAITAQNRAEKINGFLQDMLRSAAPEQKGKDVKVAEVLSDASTRVETEFADQPDQQVELLYTLAETYQSLGEMEIGKDKAQRCLEMSVQHFGESSKMSAYCRLLIGSIQTILGDYENAEQLLRQSLATQQNLSLTKTKEYIKTKYTLGELLLRKNNINEAGTLFDEAIAESGQILDESSLEVKSIEMSRGRVRQISGDLDAAETAYRNVIEFFRRSPRYRAQLVATQINLGRVLIWKNRLPEAEAVLLEAEPLSQSILSDAGYVRGMILNYRSEIYFYQGDYAKMTTVASESLQLLERIMKSDSEDLLNVKTRFAYGLFKEGKPGDAEKNLREVLEIVKNRQNNEAWRMPLTELRLAQALLAQNKLPEAENLLVSSADQFKSILGDKHKNTQEAIKEVVALYEKTHNQEAAARYRALLIPSQ